MVNELENNLKEKKSKGNFPNLTPRRGSLPGDYNRPSPQTPKFPLSSPTTPKSVSPTRLNFNTFSPIYEDFEETNEILEGLLSKGQKSSDKILNRLLTAKEHEIERLEAEKQAWLAEKKDWNKEQINHQQTQKKLTNQNKELEHLKNELGEITTLFSQEIDKNKKLNRDLNHEKTKYRQQETELERINNENYRLKVDREQLHTNLENKINRLTELKTLAEEEKEQLQSIISEQQNQFAEKESQQAKKYNNLRAFQIIASDNNTLSIGRGRPLHNRNYSYSSVPVTRDSSPYHSIYEPEPTKPTNLFIELTQADYFNPPRTSSPLSINDDNPFEKKPCPTSLPLTNPLLIQKNSQVFEDLLSEVDDFTAETTQEQENNQELLTENEQLKDKLVHSETAYQIIVEEHNKEMEKIRSLNQQQLQELQEFDKKEVAWKDKEQRLEEELAELKYKLKEKEAEFKNSDAINTELDEELARMMLAEKQKKQAFTELEKEADELDDVLQESWDVLKQFEAQIEAVNYHQK